MCSTTKEVSLTSERGGQLDFEGGWGLCLIGSVKQQPSDLCCLFLSSIVILLKENDQIQYIPLQRTQSTSRCMSYQKRKMSAS